MAVKSKRVPLKKSESVMPVMVLKPGVLKIILKDTVFEIGLVSEKVTVFRHREAA